MHSTLWPEGQSPGITIRINTDNQFVDIRVGK